MKRLWTKLRLYSSVYARPVITALIWLGAIIALYTYRLGYLVPGYSRPELQSLSFSDGLEAIRYNPLNAPVTLIQYFLQTSRFDTAAWLRFGSSIFGIISALLFHRIVRFWYSSSVSWLATILFASSAWLLHSSRLAVPLVLQVLVLIIVLLGVELQRSKGSKPVLFFGTIAAAVLAYIPGMLVLMVAGVVWQRSRIVRAFRRNEGWFAVLCATLGLALLLPLVLAIFVDIHLLYALTGVPDKLISVSHLLSNIVEVPVQLFFRGPADPVLWLGRLPLLEIFSSLMFVVGVYACSKLLLLDRVKILFGLGLVLWFLVALGGSVRITVLLPVVYLVIAVGISYLLEAWLSIFPRNPLARGVGVFLLGLAVGSVVYFNIQSYFVAWPHSPVTKAAFRSQQP